MNEGKTPELSPFLVSEKKTLGKKCNSVLFCLLKYGTAHNESISLNENGDDKDSTASFMG